MVDLVAMVLAAARVTRLVTWDSVFDGPRGWLSGRHRWLEGLLGCSWCAGFWVSTVMVGLWMLFAGEWWWVLGVYGLAVSYVVGLLAERVEG